MTESLSKKEKINGEKGVNSIVYLHLDVDIISGTNWNLSVSKTLINVQTENPYMTVWRPMGLI